MSTAERAERVSGGVIANLKEIARRIKAHNVMVTSAGIAFYGLLALVPTLIALVSIYGLVTDPADIQGQVEDVAGSLDGTTKEFVTDLLTGIVGDNKEPGGSVAAWIGLIVGILIALWSASGAVQKLISTISVAYEAREGRPGWRLRLMAYGFTAAAILGVAAMALVIGAAPALLDQVDLGRGLEAAISILQFPLLGLLFGGALTILYRYSPHRSTPTPWKNPGAVVGTLLFIFFAIAFSVYSANVGLLPASYGLLGSIAALMIFLQLTAIAVIIGAEVNSAIEVGDLANPAKAALASPTSAGGALVPASPVASSVDGRSTEPAEPGRFGFGQALAWLIALFALARGLKD